MRLIWFFATLVVCATAASLNKQSNANESEKMRYDNFKVYKLNIKNKLQLKVITYMEDLSDKYSIWKDYDEATHEIHIMVDPKEDENFLDLLQFFGIENELMVNDVQELIDEEKLSAPSTTGNREFDWSRYYTFDEIEKWMDGILAAYPDVTQSIVIGKSYENRTIRGIKISYKSNNPGVFIESNIHAREWISSATATWFINELLTSEDPDVRYLAENINWCIIPVFNVDGFVYSHEKNRMWRKTRQPVQTSRCIGTDANRNFDCHWMQNNGASDNPCSETYAGPKAFSEPEAAALAKYVIAHKDKINIYLAFHSYGQYLLSPNGYSKEEIPDNYNDLLDIGKAFRDAVVSLPYKTKYKYGSTSSLLYVASGNSVDWAYTRVGIRLGYTIEFRDKGRYGFILPPKEILPNCKELMSGMVALINRSKELGYLEVKSN